MVSATGLYTFAVSTRSRPKAAGLCSGSGAFPQCVSTRSRPKAAGHHRHTEKRREQGFNTQPPEGGWEDVLNAAIADAEVSTRSRPKAAGYFLVVAQARPVFQHAAARRRLGLGVYFGGFVHTVSTRSRPKAAGKHRYWYGFAGCSFNTQPPEGGWACKRCSRCANQSFNTQPPEGGWGGRLLFCVPY